MRGSILGIGTDVGGSIRVPAACNGLYGVKPSHGRVPYANQQGGGPEGSTKLAIEPTAGPIATTMRDCEMLLQAIADSNPEMVDPDCVAQPWCSQAPLDTKRNKPLRVGIAASDGQVVPLPPVDNLIREVSKALERSSQHIEVVQLDLAPLLSQTQKVFNGFMSIDGANNWFDLFELTGESLHPWLQGRLTRRPRKDLLEVKKLQGQKFELQTAFLDVWKESGGYWLSDDSKAGIGDRVLDVLIFPVAPHPIAPVDRWVCCSTSCPIDV
jgi:Asp-tRNA(Asn)/Glu-tRNA(Gln) amidotransferase A subunit family amidase